MIFKCKNCDGNVIYSPEKKEMFCPYCESANSQERKDSEGDMSICPNCGGEVPVEEHTSAVQCPYCDNFIILNQRVEGEYAPDVIIPFQLGKEMVKKLMRDNFSKCIFAPTDFLSEARLNSMEGDYIPFWLYDYETSCKYRGEGHKVRSWTTGEVQYTETNIYEISRNMDIHFQKIPVDASERMPDQVMNLLEPYQYGEMEPFKPEYLSGFLGEKYNMPAQQVEPRARAKMEDDARELLKNSISGYTNVIDQAKSVQVLREQKSYGLLPVWVYQYRYHEKEYPFYINGQTAKIIGKIPVSSAKVWTYGITLWALLTAGLSMLYGILYFL